MEVNSLNGIKLKMLIMGCILIILGSVIYFLKGVDIRVLILPVVGIVLLIGGIVYPNRKKGQEALVK